MTNLLNNAVLATPAESVARTENVAAKKYHVSPDRSTNTSDRKSSPQRAHENLDSLISPLSESGGAEQNNMQPQQEMTHRTPSTSEMYHSDTSVDGARVDLTVTGTTKNPSNGSHVEQAIIKVTEKEACTGILPSPTPFTDDVSRTVPDYGDTSAENERATITKLSFDDRLASLQVKMESQLIEQLKRLEEKITAPRESLEQLSKSSEALSEMSARIVKLQADLGSKELEILSLRREVAALESKLANSVASALSSVDRLIDDGWLSPEKVKPINLELESKQKQLHELQTTVTELGGKLDKASRDHVSSMERCTRQEQKIQSIEIALDEERSNKEKSLEQSYSQN